MYVGEKVTQLAESSRCPLKKGMGKGNAGNTEEGKKKKVATGEFLGVEGGNAGWSR